MKKIYLVISLLAFANVYASPRKKVLVLISSATSVQLASPKAVGSVPAGFYLVEMGKMLREYESTTDFVFATPDGQSPTIDVNSLDLNSQTQGWTAPWKTLSFDLRNVQLGNGQPGSDFDFRKLFGLDDNPAEMRQNMPDQLAWREADVAAAIRLLGRINVSEPLINSSKEVELYRQELLPRLAQAARKTFLSFKDVIAKDNNASDPLKLNQFDFVYIPGGHAPMLDFKDNAYLGEILNRAHDQNKLIVAVCHGPIAFEAAQFRIGADGKPYQTQSFSLKGARLTTVSTYEENLISDLSYFHIPSSEPTRLTYFVDQALEQTGYEVEYGSPMIAGIQPLPGYPHIVYGDISESCGLVTEET